MNDMTDSSSRAEHLRQGKRARQKKELYLQQKQLLDTFLEHGAITQEQYDKSLGDLTKKMGMEETDLK